MCLNRPMETNNKINEFYSAKKFLEDYTPEKAEKISGVPAKEIIKADLYFIDKIGLKEHLSPTRSNGLLAMLKQMKLEAEKREQELNSISELDSDENFAFIVGYTSGGFAYGIAHKEMDEINNNEID